MKKILLLTASVASVLTGCATIIDSSSQDVNFQVVGATEVLCDVDSGKLKYYVRPPQVITIKKSVNDLTLTCEAAGNRVKVMTVPSTLSGWTLTNVTNGIIPGTAYDAESGAMFQYPDVVIIDFTDTIAKADELPGYHAVDTLDPKLAAGSVEDMGPDEAKLAEDDAVGLRHRMAKLQRDQDDAVQAEKVERKESLEGGWDGDKGNAAPAGGSGAAYVPPPSDIPAAQPPVNGSRSLPEPVFPGSTSF